ncbi:hypothetical protein PUMCH_001474 [Australozyma saopauloensis]|uniref:FHA domain-containing protein n=1 Tax=Australozyma saopauloensis TaxID=291208 RepID=A0AAX4H745_9ASCO|nr:hypothetical protein PUMCH_001474 [[Candida] saopauloensis]
MSETQFPPSSPVLHAADLYDPFTLKNKGDDSRGRAVREYPTPNPSSTIGRSSSPSRQEEEDVKDDFSLSSKPTKPVVQINRDFNVLNPDKNVLRVPLMSGRPLVVLGRSSKACDFHLRQNGGSGGKLDKTISRRHVLIQHNDKKITFRCLGHNGFTMMIPRVCGVVRKEGADEHAYTLVETEKPLEDSDGSKTICLDNDHTEFHVMRNESVEMPRYANVLLQIRDNVVLVNPEDQDEELTDEEELEQIAPVPEPVSIQTPKKKLIDSKPPTIEPKPFSIRASNVEPKPTEVKEPVVAPAVKSTSAAFSTPQRTESVAPMTPSKGSFSTKYADQTTPSVRRHKLPTKLDDDKENRAPLEPVSQYSAVGVPNRATTPLANKSMNNAKQVNLKRRAASEEPTLPKKAKKELVHDAQGKLIISQECIHDVKNVREIENILVNHLAFSRLSSTPASVLNAILATVAKLSIRQLRTVLHNAACIGVIYRQGKDAAGKPLEEEYFYEPEKDKDSERIQLLSLIKGHGGLRACRKTHKQYYWKKPAAKK